ncbi:hypothetical protein [Qipengyuania sp.]|uniref:hypothetical protein n=1 Tax=Qipengyuania sp. TaxID=2004515 RepID=UPI0035C7F44C
MGGGVEQRPEEDGGVSEIARRLALDALEEVRRWRGERFLVVNFGAVAEGITGRVIETRADAASTEAFLDLLRTMAIQMFGDMPDLQQSEQGARLTREIVQAIEEAGIGPQRWWLEWEIASKVEQLLASRPTGQTRPEWEGGITQSIITDELIKAQGDD